MATKRVATKQSNRASKATKKEPKRIPSVKRLEQVRSLGRFGCGWTEYPQDTRE